MRVSTVILVLTAAAVLVIRHWRGLEGTTNPFRMIPLMFLNGVG
jgi:hypothetical protein